MKFLALARHLLVFTAWPLLRPSDPVPPFVRNALILFSKNWLLLYFIYFIYFNIYIYFRQALMFLLSNMSGLFLFEAVLTVLPSAWKAFFPDLWRVASFSSFWFNAKKTWTSLAQVAHYLPLIVLLHGMRLYLNVSFCVYFHIHICVCFPAYGFTVCLPY